MKKKILFISAFTVLALFLVTATVWGISALYGAYKNEAATQLDENAVVWSEKTTAEQCSTGEIKVPGYGTLYFPENTATVPITLYNPAENDCLFEFVLYISGISEPIYTSAYVKPGTAITKIQLSEPLKKGEYKLNIQINTYDTASKTSLNNAVVKTDLVVQ